MSEFTTMRVFRRFVKVLEQFGTKGESHQGVLLKVMDDKALREQFLHEYYSSGGGAS